MSIAGRALTVWFVMLIVASANGAFREAVLIPKAGDTLGRAISTLALGVLIVLLTWRTIRWIHPRSAREARMIGAFWVALTLAFEFLGGRYLFSKSWSELTEDYNVLQGRIWILVLFATGLAPRLCAARRRVG
jgi:hypothetical protein